MYSETNKGWVCSAPVLVGRFSDAPVDGRKTIRGKDGTDGNVMKTEGLFQLEEDRVAAESRLQCRDLPQSGSTEGQGDTKLKLCQDSRAHGSTVNYRRYGYGSVCLCRKQSSSSGRFANLHEAPYVYEIELLYQVLYC